MLSMIWLGIEFGMLPAVSRDQVIREVGYFAERRKPEKEDGREDEMTLTASSVDAMKLNRLVRP